jgi:Carboxypeptidase regulatory-like domain
MKHGSTKHSLVCLVLLVGFCLTFAQTLPQGVIAISGKVYAPAGEDIAGTVVWACFVQGSDCDASKSKSYEVIESGDSASFTLEGLTRDAFLLFASKDTNANDVDFEDGDFYALYGADGNVTPPARDLELQLEILGSSTSAATSEPSESSGALEPFTVTGLVLDTQGQPLENAQVFIIPDLVDGNVNAVTDANGRYRVSSLVDISYKAQAYIEVPYNSQTVCQRLVMTNADETISFAVDQGAERNFQWQLTGKAEVNFYGAEIDFSYIPDKYRELAQVIEITLTPTGPLLDGSEGSVLVREFLFNETYAVEDIPLGQYTIQAVLIGNDASRTQLGLSTKVGLGTESDPNDLELAINWEPWGYCGNSGVRPLQLQLNDAN